MLMDSAIHDVRYALRGLRRAPLFTVSVAGTMGIGLGVLCSVFTIVNAYIFKSVNLPEPQQLHGLSWDTAARKRESFSLADFEAANDRNPVFVHMAAVASVSASLQGMPFAGRVVSRDYFNVLASPAALGRTLGAGDFAASTSGAVLVLSHQAWQFHFGADPNIVGNEVRLAGTPFAIIGVARPGATLPGDEGVSFWTPLSMARVFEGRDPAWNDERGLVVVGRRRPDIAAAQVDAWFGTWLRQRYPSASALAPTFVRVDRLATRVPLTSGTVTWLLLLLSAFGFVLLVACANVTNMLLARGLARQRELGVRLSLGASRSRVIRQLMIESLVLSIPAAIVGLALTFLTAYLFPRLVTTTIPGGAQFVTQVLAPFDPDVRVLAFLIGAGVLASLIVGLSPALQLTRPNLVDAVRGQLGPNTRVSGMRNAFVVIQIATCVLFLVAAIGLVAESSRMASEQTGLDYERILDLRVPAAMRPAVAATMATRSDVEQVTAVWRPPLIGPMWRMRIVPTPGRGPVNAGFMGVSPEYFAAFGVEVRLGRAFTRSEAEQGAAVAVISAATARVFWPGEDPLGRTFEIAPAVNVSLPRPRSSRITVIGIAEDVVNGTLLDGVAETSVYFPTTAASAEVSTLLVRMRGDAAVAIRSIVSGLEAAFPTAAFQATPLHHHAAVQVWSFRAFSTAALIPAIVGLLLAIAGTYGVVAFVMAQRTREFGIRMALGASAGHVIRSVVGRMAAMALVAATVGLGATVVMFRGVAALVPIAPAVDVRIYVVGAAVVVLASAAASLIPALRAIRIDPSTALRAE